LVHIGQPRPAGISLGLVTYCDHVEIDHESGTPVWRQLADFLRAQIEAGDIEPGKLLPSTRTLMQRYGVSDGTVKRAVGQLRSEGLVKTEPGRGVYVAGQKG
jgi:DNA-binding GntR family transcriptional regulator